MANAKSTYFSVEAKIKSKTDTTATIEWSWKRTKGYFGYCNSKEALVIKGANGYKNHLGIPKKWESKWGSRSKNLTDGKSHKVVENWGSLTGKCANEGSYTETVTLDRGNNRSTTKEITVGIEGTKEEKSKWECLVTLSVSTSTIKDPENVSNITINLTNKPLTNFLNGKVLSIFLTYTNPENYYTAKLYSEDINTGEKLLLASENNTRPGYVGAEYNLIDTITFLKYYYDKKFIVEIVGKDGKVYVTKTAGPFTRKTNPMPEVLSIYAKINGEVKNITELYFKNRNYKKIPNVYAKVPGKGIVEIKERIEV